MPLRRSPVAGHSRKGPGGRPTPVRGHTRKHSGASKVSANPTHLEGIKSVSESEEKQEDVAAVFTNYGNRAGSREHAVHESIGDIVAANNKMCLDEKIALRFKSKEFVEHGYGDEGLVRFHKKNPEEAQWQTVKLHESGIQAEAIVEAHEKAYRQVNGGKDMPWQKMMEKFSGDKSPPSSKDHLTKTMIDINYNDNPERCFIILVEGVVSD